MSGQISQYHCGIAQDGFTVEHMPQKVIDEFRSHYALVIGLDLFLIQAQLPRGERGVWGEASRFFKSCSVSTTATKSTGRDF